jgi:predicted DNA-binding protein
MTQPSTGEKIPLTVHLSPEVAKRLKAACETQKRPAADLVAELLDRHLPRLPSGGQQKTSIPYA